MDPPTLMNHGSFNLAEIWPFALNGAANGESNGNGLELRTGSQYNQIWGQFSNTSNSNNNHNHHNDSHKDVAAIEHLSSNGVVVDHHRVLMKNGGVARKRREGVLDDESTMKLLSTSSGIINGNGVDENEGKRIKTPEDENHEAVAEVEVSSGKLAEQKTQPTEPPKQDYIHVRARRGQATDSHSLAERARREKISERMKILQDLVPGCNKVIGKALVLDEIINYIQSLQRQVEFLSMKLETVNSRNPGIEGFSSKDFCQQTYESAGIQYGSQAATEYVRGASPEWLHMQVGGGFERTT